MWTPWIKTEAGSKFLGIVAAIEEDVAAGRLAEGDRMPAQRGVAAALGIDLTTVTRAYGEAKVRGLLTAAPGRGGTRVAPAAPGKARRSLADPVDLSLNIPPQPARADLGARITRATAEVLRAGTRVLQYHSAAGSDADRAAAAAWLRGTRGIGRPGQIVVAAEAQAALYATCQALLGPGAVVCCGALTYPGIRAAVAARGAVLQGLVMDEGGIVPEAFAEACARGPVAALYLVPTMDNPTTATIDAGRRAELARIAAAHGVTIIEDDPYRELAVDPPPAIAGIAPAHTVHIATLAKCATPGLRVAYLLAPSTALADRIADVLRASTLMAPPLMTAVASRWIADGTLLGIVAALREECAARQEIAVRHLGAAAFRSEANAPHIWLPLPAPWSGDAFAAAAARDGVAVVPASAFAVGAAAPAAVRISLGAAPSRPALTSGLRRIAALLVSGPERREIGVV
ncbi:PLP-dependent aminotransferase family protein [Methylobrevis sp. L22]|uniref:PLP-dependent aminotransferase family protein n=2 Tax=Methylobrevis albus TaxID=2793297 RepID=A0A931I3X8_9HYPH|nr:PLP-dependent aminotransferase family protein [Methylobrevis albus]